MAQEEPDDNIDVIEEVSIPLMLHEIRQQFDVSELSTRLQVQITIDGVINSVTADLNELNNDQVRNDSSNSSCGYCSKAERVVDVTSFAKGQHISMLGQLSTKYLESRWRLKSVYKHHAIVKKVNYASGTKAELVLIHFSQGSDGQLKLNIHETTETFDLRQNDIFHVRYVHPRYEQDDIVRRAESMLPENRTGEAPFDSYSLLLNNCEHFATWCVIDKGKSFQVQGLTSTIRNVLRKVGGYVSLIDLFHCIRMIDNYEKKYKEGHMCCVCYKSKLETLFVRYVTDAVGALTGPPLPILLDSLICFRRKQHPMYRLERNQIFSLSSVQIGDIISFKYYIFEHVAVVTEIDESNHRVTCVHYAAPSLFSTRIVKEETFTLDPSKNNVQLFDCTPLQCRPKHKVVEMARKRVNETKWSISSNKSNNTNKMCYWAKVKTPHRSQCLDVDMDNKVSALIKATAFLRDQEVHLMTDILLGDVVKHDGWRGILVKLETLDNSYGRNFKMERLSMALGAVCKERHILLT